MLVLAASVLSGFKATVANGDFAQNPCPAIFGANRDFSTTSSVPRATRIQEEGQAGATCTTFLARNTTRKAKT